MKRFLTLLFLFSLTISVMNSCSNDTKSTDNPFFEEWNTPFGVPPFSKIKPEHYKPAIERGISLQNEEIAAIVACGEEPTFENTIAPFDASGELLSDVVNIFSMICSADTNEQLQAIEEEMMPRLSIHSAEIYLNDALFERVHKIYEKRNSLNLSDIQKRLVEKIHNTFVRNGALLNKDEKERMKKIGEELSSLSVRFQNNLLAENSNYELDLTEDDVQGLEYELKTAARAEAKRRGYSDKYVITLSKSLMIPFLTQCPRRDLREQIYKAYLQRCSNQNEYDNRQIIADIITLRTEMAHMLGYNSYAEFVISDQMASKPKAVNDLLEQIYTPALEKAKEELQVMDELFKVDNTEGATFESWDWWYYAEKIRKRDYSFEDNLIKSYFSLGNVRQGVFELANKLYGITFRPLAVEVYHPDVMAYEVIDKDLSHLGVLYFDFYARPSKGQGAWCGYYRSQRYSMDGLTRKTPVVGIVCNFARPGDNNSSTLLSIDETQTLFHEFGHALHFLFTNVRYNGLIDVEGDFVELPSQIMEHWATEPEMLRLYAVHHHTQETIPPSIIKKIEKAALFNQGFMTTELVAAALLDQDIHSLKDYIELDPIAFENNSLKVKRGLIPQIESRYRLPYFQHIFSGGYSAGYYFYIWAEVLDCDAFAAFKESGDIFDHRTAEAFRREVLSRGGSLPGMTMYTNFRGKDPDKTPMLKERGLYEEPETEEITEETKEN